MEHMTIGCLYKNAWMPPRTIKSSYNPPIYNIYWKNASIQKSLENVYDVLAKRKTADPSALFIVKVNPFPPLTLPFLLVLSLPLKSMFSLAVFPFFILLGNKPQAANHVITTFLPVTSSVILNDKLFDFAWSQNFLLHGLQPSFSLLSIVIVRLWCWSRIFGVYIYICNDPSTVRQW